MKSFAQFFPSNIPENAKCPACGAPSTHLGEFVVKHKRGSIYCGDCGHIGHLEDFQKAEATNNEQGAAE